MKPNPPNNRPVPPVLPRRGEAAPHDVPPRCVGGRGRYLHWWVIGAAAMIILLGILSPTSPPSREPSVRAVYDGGKVVARHWTADGPTRYLVIGVILYNPADTVKPFPVLRLSDLTTGKSYYPDVRPIWRRGDLQPHERRYVVLNVYHAPCAPLGLFINGEQFGAIQ